MFERNISDLTGIEDFSALTTLICNDNNLTSLNLSNNTALTELYAANNKLNNLDVSKSTALKILYCYGNELISLDVTENPALSYLICYGNQLTSLDVTNNKVLTELRCKANNLTSIDLSMNRALTVLSFDDNQLTSLDVTESTELIELSVASNNLSNLDVSKNTALEILNCFQNDIINLNLSNNSALTQLYTASNELTSLDVSKNPTLEILYCYGNELTSLDVSTNPALSYLICYGNQLTSLDVTNNTALTELRCNVNNLSSIDLSKNTALTVLNCGDNQLTGLDVAKNIELTELWAYNNYLNNLDVSKNIDLIKLICYDTQLTSLDVSNNTKLTKLQCGFNPLTSMDVSLNTSLEFFFCPNSNLTSLNLKNGNNHNIINEDFHLQNNPDLFCVEVDDVSYSSTNWTTYVDDQVEFKNNCYDSLASEYVIIAEEKVELENHSDVLSGSVGVIADDGEAIIKDFSDVAETVEASEIKVDYTSSVRTEVLSPADIDLPDFIYNTVSNDDSADVKVEDDEMLVLDGQVFNKIEVKEGATLTFTAGNIFINELKTEKHTTIKFADCANVFINKKLVLKEFTNFNLDMNNVTLYVDDKVEVKKGSNVSALIYTNENEKIKAEGKEDSPTYMKGMFVAKRVESKDFVTWNKDANLSPCSIPPVESSARIADTKTKGKTKIDVSKKLEEPIFEIGEFSVKTWPIPSNGNFNIKVYTPSGSEIVIIKVYDVKTGIVVHADEFNSENEYIFGYNLQSGIYAVKIYQASNIKTFRVIKN